MTTEPLAAESLAAESLAAEPTVAGPSMAEPLAAEAPSTESRAAEPLSAETWAADATEAEPAADTPLAPHAAADLPLERALEAILIVADEPQPLVDLASAVGAPLREVRQAIANLVADFDGLLAGSVRRGFELREVGGGWRIYVRTDYDEVVTDYVHTQNPARLSPAALETLAVIAYKQPITRGAVAAIRAVNVDSVVRTLAGRGLITEVFTDSETGAIHYGTTDLLLTQLGLNSLDELPPISPLLPDGADGFDSDLRPA